ncbi:MAG: hypothetical protein AB1791_16180 [Chloroflexota bacterium]
MGINVMVTRTSRVWLEPSGIVRVVILPRPTITREDGREIAAAVIEVGGGRARPLLVDIRQITHVEREARQQYHELDGLLRAAAFVVGSPVSWVIGSFFLTLNKLPYPTRLFSSEAEAMAWLAGFIE